MSDSKLNSYTYMLITLNVGPVEQNIQPLSCEPITANYSDIADSESTNLSSSSGMIYAHISMLEQ